MSACPLAFLDISHLPILLIVGVAIFFGTIGARVFQRLRIPQVVGYIAIGLAVGRSGLQLIDDRSLASMEPFNFFALGLIGFMIGGELHRDVFRKFGRQFFIILLSEGLGAFFAVGLLVTALAFILTGQWETSLALGIVLGAISSATAPAATVDVLWEYKSRGVLTTMVFAIVALDDGLALALYGIASSVATNLTGRGGGGLWRSLGRSAYELFGAAVMGVAVGFLLNFLLRRFREPEKAMTFIIGSLALLLGGALVLEVDLILSAMALGVTLTNLAPRRSHPAFEIVERFAAPIYVLFFVNVGARLSVGTMPGWMWILAGAYVVGRTGGKMAGAYLGARWARAADSVRKYLGLCLFSQAGVAVGLSILASSRFAGEMGNAILMIVTGTTFLVQIIGPPSVKVAIKGAGEIGMDVTEEDLMKEHLAGEMVDRTVPHFGEGTAVTEILRTLAETEAASYPVVDEASRLTGVITIDDLKQSFRTEGMSRWLVAYDVMQPPPDTVTEDTPLTEAVTRMREQELDYMPVVSADGEGRLTGMLERRRVHRALSREVLRRRDRADEGGAAAQPEEISEFVN